MKFKFLNHYYLYVILSSNVFNFELKSTFSGSSGVPDADNCLDDGIVA